MLQLGLSLASLARNAFSSSVATELPADSLGLYATASTAGFSGNIQYNPSISVNGVNYAGFSNYPSATSNRFVLFYTGGLWKWCYGGLTGLTINNGPAYGSSLPIPRTGYDNGLVVSEFTGSDNRIIFGINNVIAMNRSGSGINLSWNYITDEQPFVGGYPELYGNDTTFMPHRVLFNPANKYLNSSNVNSLGIPTSVSAFSGYQITSVNKAGTIFTPTTEYLVPNFPFSNNQLLNAQSNSFSISNATEYALIINVTPKYIQTNSLGNTSSSDIPYDPDFLFNRFPITVQVKLDTLVASKKPQIPQVVWGTSSSSSSSAQTKWSLHTTKSKLFGKDITGAFYIFQGTQGSVGKFISTSTNNTRSIYDQNPPPYAFNFSPSTLGVKTATFNSAHTISGFLPRFDNSSTSTIEYEITRATGFFNDFTNFYSSACVGDSIDLSDSDISIPSYLYSQNTTNLQKSVASGSGTINGNILTFNGAGNVVVAFTATSATHTDATRNKTITVTSPSNVSANTSITITATSNWNSGQNPELTYNLYANPTQTLLNNTNTISLTKVTNQNVWSSHGAGSAVGDKIYIKRELSGWKLYSFATIVVASGWDDDNNYYEQSALRKVVHANNSNPSISKIPTTGWTLANESSADDFYGELQPFVASGTFTIS